MIRGWRSRWDAVNRHSWSITGVLLAILVVAVRLPGALGAVLTGAAVFAVVTLVWIPGAIRVGRALGRARQEFVKGLSGSARGDSPR